MTPSMQIINYIVKENFLVHTQWKDSVYNQCDCIIFKLKYSPWSSKLTPPFKHCYSTDFGAGRQSHTIYEGYSNYFTELETE